MILVDTSIWADHIRSADETLGDLLESKQALMHPCVLTEIALGKLPRRSAILSAMEKLPQAKIATDSELLDYIERHRLFGSGIGFVDTHLLAATRLTHGALLWTRDKNLLRVAERLGLAWRRLH
ncbi:MAG: type II toxin-antitoxin system VapC family toxin [Alphaproteobacteria bacterium]|nr:type II toxin-antitoxin system VapC family toxin [Alphaproteobacteria bacterium]